MKTKPTTNRRLIVRTYLQTILITTVLSLLLTTGVMSALLFSNSTTSANKMVQSLEKTFVHVTPNTDAWQASSQQGASTTYVKIRILPTTSTSAQTFYSTGSKNFTQQTAHHLSSNFLWVKGKGLFVYRQQATTKAVYHVWLSLDETLRELGTVLIAILLVSLLSTSLGIILINLLSRRITKPLTDLTAAVTAQTKQSTAPQTPLPIPESPVEVQQLATQFNHLLDQLNAQMLREQQFVSDASHELRTPLTAIRGYVSLLQHHGKDHPEVFDESLQFLDSESLRLQELVESLLRVTRNERLQVTLKPVTISELVTQLVQDYQEQVPSIQLTCQAGVTANADENSLKQMVLALLDNARKYSPEAALLTVNVKATDQQATIQIGDQGIGIPDDQKAKIFDRFYRVDAARSSKISGTGLGLAIVSQLAALNQATVTVTDNVPQGSVFTIALPMAG